MSSLHRRSAIAQFATLEQISATTLYERADAPVVKVAAEWIRARLSEIEPFFLEHADDLSDPWRERWLNAAERWLEFYVSELRRLEDLAGEQSDASTWTRH